MQANSNAHDAFRLWLDHIHLADYVASLLSHGIVFDTEFLSIHGRRGMSTYDDPSAYLDWPASLLEAPRQFGAWSKAQLLTEQAQSTPSEPLYHYTGEAGLRGILGQQRLWCFSHLHQSDATEFEYALAVARRIIREVGESDDFFTRQFCACLDDMLEANGLASPFDFYLFNLSRYRDHTSQWDQYGQKGSGYALGLAPSLFQPDRDELYEEANKNLHVGRVIYGDEATETRHRLSVERAAEITSCVGLANVELVRRVTPGKYLAAMAHELLASQLIWNCLTAKDRRYEDEREVRCIVLNVKSKFDPYRLTRGGRTYIEHELPLKAAGSIVEILIGPRAPPDTEASVSAFLRAEGYQDTIPVRRAS
jgi:hypothetical protein